MHQDRIHRFTPVLTIRSRGSDSVPSNEEALMETPSARDRVPGLSTWTPGMVLSMAPRPSKKGWGVPRPKKRGWNFGGGNVHFYEDRSVKAGRAPPARALLSLGSSTRSVGNEDIRISTGKAFTLAHAVGGSHSAGRASKSLYLALVALPRPEASVGPRQEVGFRLRGCAKTIRSDGFLGHHGESKSVWQSMPKEDSIA